MEGDFLPLWRDVHAALVEYNAWELPLRRFRAENYRRLNRDGYTWESYQQGLAELETQLAAVHDPHAALHPLFRELCAAYIAADDARRAAIRAFCAREKKLGPLLWRYANRITCELETAHDQELVRTALAAVAIDNCSANYRDTLMTLADLFVAAESAGIDPGPLFVEASLCATDEVTSGGCESLASMLHDFYKSPTLRERRGMHQPYGGPA